MPVKPPRPPSPPLTALRAFEAAARLGGFTHAADELCVTPGAVAQQVKILEAWAGAPLFRRQRQGVDLTEAGRQCLPDLTRAFDQIGMAVRSLQQATAPNRVQVAALPAVAQLWLSPRLPAIRAAWPDLVLSVTALESPPNLSREPFDLALFYSNTGQVLSPDVIFPVCTPELAKGLCTPADLLSVRCLSDLVWNRDWGLWLAEAGLTDAVVRGPVHSLYALAVEDALSGAGVLMAHEALVAGHLSSGRLVAPFATRLTLPQSLRMIGREGPRPKMLDRLMAALGGEGGL
ncbi:LysR family transcriptional regulator [Shimia biformata]|uniref:LysR family transcriptional regulator n=1 Tax=Shimia biformata TaxID=1294299 RepID=UPI00194F13DF|nr:LysR family transcriptional regulator [Shimia biformata]